MIDGRRQTTASIPFLLSADEQEENRLVAVHRYNLLDATLDEICRPLVTSAASMVEAPAAAIGIVGAGEIRFKACRGLKIGTMRPDAALFGAGLASRDPIIIPDAFNDPRARSSVLVAGPEGLRFFLGAPLVTSDGFNIGILFVMDRVPRRVTGQQIESVQILASVVMDHLDLHLTARHSAEEFSRILAEKDRALSQAALMALEIDHRVMNSLQLVSGILSMQSQSQPDGDARDQLRQAAGRVSAIARVHQHIYLTEGIGETKCRNYLQRVCSDLSPVLEATGRGPINVMADDITLPTARIVAIGLITNELVTNAIKYGLGKVSVDFSIGDDGFTLGVSDEGPGPPAIAPANGKARGFGMTVIAALVTQLHGKLDVVRRGADYGTRYIVTFPEEAEFTTPH